MLRRLVQVVVKVWGILMSHAVPGLYVSAKSYLRLFGVESLRHLGPNRNREGSYVFGAKLCAASQLKVVLASQMRFRN